MEKLLHILIHSFEDTIILLPFLFLIYLLIEFLEYKNVFKFEKSKLLNGKASPIVGSCFGIIPQCGFSVISAELFSEKKMSLAALVAVFLATSDEAFPILLSNYKSIPVLIALLISKFIIALIVGYIVMFISQKLIKFKSSPVVEKSAKSQDNNQKTHQNNQKNHHEHNQDNNHEEDNNHHENETHIHACCHHDILDHNKFNWIHPIIHSIKITAYIFIVNLILGGFFELVGENNIANFLTSSSAFQPLFALIIGFIPNCASSVIITELYTQGLLSFGSIITGLCANAGIGLFILFKANKNIKENVFIVLTLIISSLIFGYIFHFIPFNFL